MEGPRYIYTTSSVSRGKLGTVQVRVPDPENVNPIALVSGEQAIRPMTIGSLDELVKASK